MATTKRGPGGPNKTKYPRDGWNGRRFREMREARGDFAALQPRSVEWIAARTGVCADTIRGYETGRRFPPHRWRDAAALALRVDRGLLGREGE